MKVVFHTTFQLAWLPFLSSQLQRKLQFDVCDALNGTGGCLQESVWATLINKIILMLVKPLQHIHHFTINVWYKLSKYGWFAVLIVYQNYVPQHAECSIVWGMYIIDIYMHLQYKKNGAHTHAYIYIYIYIVYLCRSTSKVLSRPECFWRYLRPDICVFFLRWLWGLEPKCVDVRPWNHSMHSCFQLRFS